MKYRKLDNWKNINQCEALLFFSQRLDEILFNYSLDSYKSAALNTPFLCREALMTINEIEKGNIDKNNLLPILEELEWSIKNDDIAKEIIELNYSDLIPENKSNININIQKIHLEIIGRSINPNVYLFKTQEKIIKSIEKNQKNILDSLMKNWVTTLINIGYSKRYIHSSNKDFFFSQKIITDNNQIKEFLSLFLPYRHAFQIYFKSTTKTTTYKKILNEYDIKILTNENDSYDSISNKFLEIGEELNDDEVILHVENVDGFDIFSARKNAEETLENARNLILLYSHKTPISWSQTSISHQCCKEGLQYITSSHSAISMIADLRPQIAAGRIEYFLENISLKQGSTFDRFNRIIGLHGLCAIQDAPETQFLNLWICIETLIPSDNSKSKIENILSKSSPILCLIYIRKIIRNLLKDMLNWNKRKTKELLSKIKSPTEDLTEKLILFLSKHHSEDRNNLFKELDDFPLLRNRIFNLSSVFSDTKKIESLINSHSKKINWQIRRIYRTRNLIVHSGSTPTYLSTLIENTHEYLDSMINEIIQLSCGPRRISTFNQAFEFLRIKYEEYIKNFKNINMDNREDILKIFIDRESRKTISEIFEDHEKSLQI